MDRHQHTCSGGTTSGQREPQVDAVVGKNRSAYLDTVLNADPEADPGARATPMPVVPERAPYPDGGTAAQRYKWVKLCNDQMLELNLWWLRRMVVVQEPIHEKLTLLWHNHFATSAAKVPFATYMGAQNRKLRALSWWLPRTRLCDVDGCGHVVLAGWHGQCCDFAQ